MKKRISDIAPHMHLFQDTITGIAFVEDGLHGMTRTLHPSIDVTGSATGMKKTGMWEKSDKVVKMRGFKYNIDTYVPDSDSKINEALLTHCKCGGRHSHEKHKDRESEPKGPQR